MTVFNATEHAAKRITFIKTTKQMKTNEQKEKARLLVKHFMPVVYPYVGSAFLTGTEDEDYKLQSAKTQAKFVIEQILHAGFPYSESGSLFKFLQIWKGVEGFIDSITLEEVNL